MAAAGLCSGLTKPQTVKLAATSALLGGCSRSVLLVFMYACMYVHIFTYIHVWVHICIYCKYVYIYAYMYIYAYVYAYAYMYISAHVHKCMYVYIDRHTHKHTQAGAGGLAGWRSHAGGSVCAQF